MKWAPIPGYEDTYIVSDAGDVVRVSANSGTTPGRKLRPVVLRSGYVSASLSRGSIVKQFRLHRLVWSAFRGSIPEGKEINHKNGDKTDNRLTNLEIATRSENMLHAYRVLKIRLPDHTKMARDASGRFRKQVSA